MKRINIHLLCAAALLAIVVLAPAIAQEPPAPQPNVPKTWTEHTFTAPDGTVIHYLEQGQGVPVILLHGAGTSGSSWFVDEPGTAQLLAKTNRVIAPDARGMGQSQSGPPGNNETMIRDVVALMDYLKIQKAHIAGYSMGGALTAGLMRIAPDRFLTAAPMGIGIKDAPEWSSKAPKDPEAPAGAARAAGAAPPARSATAGAAAPPARGSAPQMNGNPDPEQDVDLTKIKFPVLSVVGEYDRPYYKTTRMWRELQDFTFVMIPGANHGQARRTQRLANALARFITSYDRQGPIAPR